MSNSSLQINQGTNASINFDLNGGTNTQVVALGYGTLSTIGTLPTITINTPNIGTIGTLGLGSVVVNTLPNIPGGSIVVTTGTIPTLGTMGTVGLINTVTTISNITNGSIIVTAGTIVNNGGSAIAYGPAATAAAAVGNPLNIGGTDSGGTIRTIKVDSGGLQRVGIDSGTISVLPNLPQGSINVTAGTIASVGTIGTLGLGSVVSGNAIGVGVPASAFFGGIQDSSNNLAGINSAGKQGDAAAGNNIPTSGLWIYNSSNYDRVRSINTANGGTGLGVLAVGALGEDSGGTMHSIAVSPTSGSAGTIILPNIPGGTLGSITNIGTINQLIPGTTSTTLGKSGSNQSYVSGDVGILMLGQNNNSFNIQTSANGQYSPLSTDQFGQLYTQSAVSNVAKGTIQINQLPTQAMTAYGTMGTQTSGTTFFTIQGTVGAGTEAIVSDWSIVVMAGTCGASLSFGTNSGSFVQGTGVIAAGTFPAGGGIAQSVESALNSGTNGAIYAGLYGNGTAYYHVSYYKAATTV